MTQIKKLVEKLKARPTDLRLSEVERLMEAYGAEKKAGRGKGNHNVFVLPGKGSFTVPTRDGGKKVAGVYADKIMEFLGIED